MNDQKPNKRQRKLLLMLPALAFPFATLFFWAMGGGANAQTNNKTPSKGLNMQLPTAQLKNDSAENKLSFYQKAEKDSLKRKEAMKDDPYYKQDGGNGTEPVMDSNRRSAGSQSSALTVADNYPGLINNHSQKGSLADNEQRIGQKLALLKQQLNQPQEPASINHSQEDQIGKSQQPPEALLQKMNNNNSEDPEMKQLADMLDKIQEIQNPGLVQQRLKEQSLRNRGQVFAVSAVKKENLVSTLTNNDPNLSTYTQSNSFYSLDNIAASTDSQNSVAAVVHETQTLVAGATVKMRLVNNMYINGTLIPKDNFVFGTASLNGERLNVKITSIRYRNSIFPVDLSVYDLDGAEGIYVPGAITRDVAKESADQSIQNLGFATYDPSLGAQAASAGITAAKSLFSRKVRLVKVTVKAGYQILLRDEKQKQSN